MYRLSEKGERIRSMFGEIAPTYDFLNRLLSLGIDRRWRKKAVRLTRWSGESEMLDVATGTGDVALEIAAQTPGGVRITGIDFTPQMIELGKQKVAASPYAGRISMQVAPCEEIPFADGRFDSVTIAFGIRNVVNRAQGLSEMHRVLRGGGRIVILEFSTPKSRAFNSLYSFYFHRVLPAVGGLFSRKSAYRYLPESVDAFPSRTDFMKMMTEAGFENVTCTDVTFGIASIYTGDKRKQ